MNMMAQTMKTKNSDKLNFKQRLEYIKGATDYNYLMEALGVKIDREGVKELRGPCPIHGGDNRTAFRFNKDTGTWVCFTKKCHESYSYDVIGLIMAVRKLDFLSAVEFLEDLNCIDGDITDKYIRFRNNKETDRLLRHHRQINEVPAIVNEISLEQFKPFRSNRFIKDGFKKETLDYFEVAGGYTDQNGVIRDIIPIRDVFGELLAYSLRDTRDNADHDFKYILTPGFNKDNVLYNLNKARHYCKDKPLIVVEGFKSVWRLHEYGIDNVVAIMGSSITKGQRMLLIAYAAKGIVILLDGDLPGIKGAISGYEDLKNDIYPITPIFTTEIDDENNVLDPADIDRETMYYYLEGNY